MAAQVEIDQYADIIDSRDILERIAWLEKEIAETFEPDEQSPDLGGELLLLRELRDAVNQETSQDCADGLTLIRASYFETYAQELAEDIGAIGRDLQWPLMHIDWEAAADQLKMDYTQIEFCGVTYWVR